MKKLYKLLPSTLEVVTMEELAELTQAISKLYRYGMIEQVRENLYEEIADVEVMIDMIKNKYELDELAIREIKEEKQLRIISRAEMGYKL